MEQLSFESLKPDAQRSLLFDTLTLMDQKIDQMAKKMGLEKAPEKP